MVVCYHCHLVCVLCKAVPSLYDFYEIIYSVFFVSIFYTQYYIYSNIYTATAYYYRENRVARSYDM